MLCWVGAPRSPQWVLGITSHFALPLLASFLEWPLLTARETPNRPKCPQMPRSHLWNSEWGEGGLFVLLAASRCCGVLHADSVLSSAEHVGRPACMCQGACNLCASGEERRGSLPAALPTGVLAAEQTGRTWLWTHSRASWTMPGPCIWPQDIGGASKRPWGQLWPCDSGLEVAEKWRASKAEPVLPCPLHPCADTGADCVLKIFLALLEGWKHQPWGEMAECLDLLVVCYWGIWSYHLTCRLVNICHKTFFFLVSSLLVFSLERYREF